MSWREMVRVRWDPQIVWLLIKAHQQASQKNLEECDSLEDVNSSELHSLARSLIEPFLRSHRSREVRGLASCCVADIFRVCHPDPPYDSSEIKVRNQYDHLNFFGDHPPNYRKFLMAL